MHIINIMKQVIKIILFLIPQYNKISIFIDLVMIIFTSSSTILLKRIPEAPFPENFPKIPYNVIKAEDGHNQVIRYMHTK